MLRNKKDLRPVGKHPLGLVWEVDLALKLHSLLGSLDVKWTSTGVVHIGIHGEFSALVDLSFGSARYQIHSLVMLASLRSLGAWIFFMAMKSLMLTWRSVSLLLPTQLVLCSSNHTWTRMTLLWMSATRLLLPWIFPSVLRLHLLLRVPADYSVVKAR